MKKSGFTLAEVLISLALIGVISSLTIPTLVTEHQKKVQAASLSAAVTNFETAMRTMMEAEDVPLLQDTRAWSGLGDAGLSSDRSVDDINTFAGNLADYIEISSVNQDTATFYDGRTVRDINRNNIGPNNWAMDNKVVLSTNNNTAYMILANESVRNTAAQIRAAGVNLQEKLGTVAIDVNGNEKPNMFGRDIFYFELGNDGGLYPFGGRDVSFISQGNVNNTWDSDGSVYACTDNAKNRFGVGCTARLIENGYKMDY